MSKRGGGSSSISAGRKGYWEKPESDEDTSSSEDEDIGEDSMEILDPEGEKELKSKCNKTLRKYKALLARRNANNVDLDSASAIEEAQRGVNELSSIMPYFTRKLRKSKVAYKAVRGPKEKRPAYHQRRHAIDDYTMASALLKAARSDLAFHNKERENQELARLISAMRQGNVTPDRDVSIFEHQHQHQYWNGEEMMTMKPIDTLGVESPEIPIDTINPSITATISDIGEYLIKLDYQRGVSTITSDPQSPSPSSIIDDASDMHQSGTLGSTALVYHRL